MDPMEGPPVTEPPTCQCNSTPINWRLSTKVFAYLDLIFTVAVAVTVVAVFWDFIEDPDFPPLDLPPSTAKISGFFNLFLIVCKVYAGVQLIRATSPGRSSRRAIEMCRPSIFAHLTLAVLFLLIYLFGEEEDYKGKGIAGGHLPLVFLFYHVTSILSIHRFMDDLEKGTNTPPATVVRRAVDEAGNDNEWVQVEDTPSLMRFQRAHQNSSRPSRHHPDHEPHRDNYNYYN